MDYLLYSKRKKLTEKGTLLDVYQYDNLPIEFRWQVIHIWKDTISQYENMIHIDIWSNTYKYFLKELGRPQLANNQVRQPFDQFCGFLLDSETPVDNILDLIEYTWISIEFCRDKILEIGYDLDRIVATNDI